MDDVLDTVFDRDHYYFWVRQIEKAAKKFVKKTGYKPNIKEINEFFREKGIFRDFDGILFQDISKNPEHYIVEGFQYKKRIHLALYNKTKMIKFVFYISVEC